MFRRISSTLPKDFDFPADLEALGYRITDEDQVRSIDNPDQEFHYWISKNERYVEMQREAMNTCIRREVLSRLMKSSVQITRLPTGTSATENHVPILTSSNLSTANRVIVYIGESTQDLGIFAYRLIGSDTIASGSAIQFVDNVYSIARDNPATVIANLGQLIWYRRGKQAMSQQTWHAIPRKTAVSQPMRVDELKNRIPKNQTFAEHVACVFEHVVDKMTNKDAKVQIIGLGDGALELVEFMQHDWQRWKSRVAAIAVGASHVWTTEITDGDFGQFWAKRARAYILSSEPLGTPLVGRKDFGCNCYSSGESLYMECIMPRAQESILHYFKVVADNPEYAAEAQDIIEEDDNDEEETKSERA